MESEFRAYSVDESDSCCLWLLKCTPRFNAACTELITKYFCCSQCCASMADSSEKRAKFARVKYRPVIDSNILTGNTLLGGVERLYYFPQTEQMVWPRHGAHFQPIKATPVVLEQPFGGEKVRRSTRLLAAFKGRRRSPSASPAAPSAFSKQHFLYDPTSPLPSLAQSSVEEADQPTLTFAAIHDIQMSTLTVFLKFASNLNYLLENPQKQTVSHPFITLHILPTKDEILQTSSDASKKPSNNPVFNQEFVFDSVPVSDLCEQTLVFRAYNGRSLIGTAKIPLGSIDLLGFTICKHIDRITEATDVEVSRRVASMLHVRCCGRQLCSRT